jgi:hypothetical protein
MVACHQATILPGWQPRRASSRAVDIQGLCAETSPCALGRTGHLRSVKRDV